MKVMNLSSRVVHGLKLFNGNSFKDVISIDRKFVKALLVCCIGGKEIAQDTLDPIAVSFIRGNDFDMRNSKCKRHGYQNSILFFRFIQHPCSK